MDNRTPDQRKVDEMNEQMASYGKFAGNGWSKDATPAEIAEAAGFVPSFEQKQMLDAQQRDGYWGGVVPPAKDVVLVDDVPAPLVDADSLNLQVDESQIEVKYTPNRAERRRLQQQARRSVRKGQRAADRRVRELSQGMTPEQVARAQELARKSLGRG
jgi:hypothetical protein